MGICQGVPISYSQGVETESQPLGFEMPKNDDSWSACLGEQGHLGVYWLHPLDLCKSLRVYYLSIFFLKAKRSVLF